MWRKLRIQSMNFQPVRTDKLGIKFQYFDLHPDYDRLEVEGGGPHWPQVYTLASMPAYVEKGRDGRRFYKYSNLLHIRVPDNDRQCSTS